MTFNEAVEVVGTSVDAAKVAAFAHEHRTVPRTLHVIEGDTPFVAGLARVQSHQPVAPNREMMISRLNVGTRRQRFRYAGRLQTGLRRANNMLSTILRLC